MVPLTDVVVVGSGPYGLAAAAHLRAAGIGVRIFGKPMEFWEQQMPVGMFLRSSWYACDISDPSGQFRLSDFQRRENVEFSRPVPLDTFVRYGHWFQRELIPDLDPRKVARIEENNGSFRLRLSDGEIVKAKRVVVAAGIARFAHYPPEFNCVPKKLISHSAEHRDLRCFSGRRVIVVGGGQSAFESAALLSEGGADVELLMREPKVRWLRGSVDFRASLGMWRRLLYPATDVGPPGLNQLIARPHLFRLLPRPLRVRFAYRAIRPAAATWLRNRMDAVKITAGRNILRAAGANGGVRVELSDGTRREGDHLLLGTGYRVDVSRFEFLAPELLRSLKTLDGYPCLSQDLESSISGLYFIGAAAAGSFGPLVRFVSGTGYSARTLTQGVVHAEKSPEFQSC
jgi:cation diffusion facilitator CzcD-associated flavoprotein CzcO